jgi:hypothetical protein
MKIKELDKSEIKELVKFYGEAALTSEQKEDEMNNFKKEIELAFGKDHLLIAMEGEKIVGFLRSQICEGKDCKRIDRVIMMLVSPEKFGTGISDQLLEKEKEYAKKIGVDVLDIDTG